MRTYFLHTNRDSRILIIFFGGFSTQISHFRHLKSQHNVLLIYDYKTIESINIDANNYEKLYLIGYSMGVCISKIIANKYSFEKKIAICGTPLGIDKALGINPAIFSHTIKNLNLDNFKKSIFGENLTLTKNFDFASLDDLKQELKSIEFFCKRECCLENTINFDEAYIAKKDNIFTPKICENAFLNTPKIKLETPHFPFFTINDLDFVCN